MRTKSKLWTSLLIALALSACAGGEVLPGAAADLDTTLPTEAAATPTSAPSAAIAEWCQLEQDVFDYDPSDPVQVEAAFNETLTFELVREQTAPPEIADDMAVIVDDLERFMGELEAVGWSFDDVDPAAGDFEPAAQAADERIHAFEVEHCGAEPRQ